MLGLENDDRSCSLMNSHGMTDGRTYAAPARCSRWTLPAWLPQLVDPHTVAAARLLYRAPRGVADPSLTEADRRIAWRQPRDAVAFRTVVLRGERRCPEARDVAARTLPSIYDKRSYAGLHWAVDTAFPGRGGTYCYGVFTVSATGRVTQAPRLVRLVFDAPPTADFSFTLPQPSTGVPIAFVDRSSDADGTVVHWHWDFGDPSSASSDVVDTADPAAGRQPQHAFAAAGTYAVSLTVTDNGGQSATVTRAVTVQ